MENKKEPKRAPGELKELLVISVILALLCAAGIVLMLCYPVQGAEFLEERPRAEKDAEAEKTELKLILKEGAEASTILLPRSATQKVSCDTAGRRLEVSLQGAEEEKDPQITADPELFVSASLYRSREESLYVFELWEMCVASWETTAEGLKIRLAGITELDERVFVAVLECGDASLPEELLRRTQEKLAEAGENIVLLRLNTENAPRTAEERESLIRYCRADAYIRLEAAERTDKAFVTQAFCDTQYYIPGLDSVLLADICESSLLKEIGGPAGDIAALKEGDPLQSLKIPACVLRLGKSTADAEMDEASADVNKRNAYLEKAATGLKDALVRASKL